MKYLIYILMAHLMCNLSMAQDNKLTPEQVEANKRFETAKQHFLNNEFNSVINYYDSILTKYSFTRFETYKMANESYSRLALIHPADSVVYLKHADEAYNQAVKWFGKMQVSERWDSLKIALTPASDAAEVIYERPEFPGGSTAFSKYISEELNYPEEALQMGIEGTVYLRFIINKDGSIDAVNVLRGIGGGCEEEAIRVVSNAANFFPGKRNGEPVYVPVSLPINFTLTSNSTGKKRKRRKRN